MNRITLMTVRIVTAVALCALLAVTAIGVPLAPPEPPTEAEAALILAEKRRVLSLSRSIERRTALPAGRARSEAETRCAMLVRGAPLPRVATAGEDA